MNVSAVRLYININILGGFHIDVMKYVTLFLQRQHALLYYL